VNNSKKSELFVENFQRVGGGIYGAVNDRALSKDKRMRDELIMGVSQYASQHLAHAQSHNLMGIIWILLPPHEVRIRIFGPTILSG
jgi:hypothetical protein